MNTGRLTVGSSPLVDQLSDGDAGWGAVVRALLHGGAGSRSPFCNIRFMRKGWPRRRTPSSRRTCHRMWRRYRCRMLLVLRFRK